MRQPVGDCPEPKYFFGHFWIGDLPGPRRGRCAILASTDALEDHHTRSTNIGCLFEDPWVYKIVEIYEDYRASGLLISADA